MALVFFHDLNLRRGRLEAVQSFFLYLSCLDRDKILSYGSVH